MIHVVIPVVAGHGHYTDNCVTSDEGLPRGCPCLYMIFWNICDWGFFQKISTANMADS